MGKRIFWIFILFISFSAIAAVVYVQSESFAKIAKSKIQSRIATELGLEMDFDRLSIGVLPPSLSMLNVNARALSAENPLGISTDSEFQVGRLGFSFRMFQTFTRGISLNKVFVSDGVIDLNLASNKKSSTGNEKLSELIHQPIKVEIGKDLFLHIRQLELKNIKFRLLLGDAKKKTIVSSEKIEYLALTPSVNGTNLVLNAENIELNVPNKLNESFKAIKANIDAERKKISITSLDVQRKEAALHASGRLIGLIDNIEDAKMDCDLILRTPIKELGDFEKSFIDFGGELKADLKLVGKVKEPAAQGSIDITNFSKSLWSVQKIEIVGSYATGLLVLDKLRATNGNGKISLKNQIEIPIPFKESSKVFELSLENARFQDFSGDLKKDINNLKFSMNGSIGVNLVFSPAEKAALSSLKLRPDLEIKDLELNNQAYGKDRPLKVIFKAEPFRLTSAIEWKNKEVRVNEGKLQFSSGDLAVTGTVSDRDGFNLVAASEEINLGKEINQIADIPLEGVGGIKVHVRGLSRAVFIDFDLKQKNAKYVNFDLGDLDGRVTYDDSKSYIYLSALKGKKNRSSYVVDGKVNIGNSDDISLIATFSDADPDDIFTIFSRQLQKISWIPHGMSGLVSADVVVGGGYSKDLESLDIVAKLKARNLSYMGEFVHELESRIGVKDGILFTKGFKARKYETFFNGELEYNLNGEMKYSLSSEDGRLRNLDWIVSAGLPVDGRVNLRSEGSGKWETLKSKTVFTLEDAFVRTNALPSITFYLDTSEASSDFKVLLGEDARMTGSIARSSKEDSWSEVQFTDTDLSYVLCTLNRKNCTDQYLNFQADGSARFSWKGSDWLKMSGKGEIKKIIFAKSGFSLRNSTAISILAESGKLQTKNFLMEGEDSKISVALEGRADGTELNNSFKGKLSLKFLEFLSPLIEEAHGILDIDLSLIGSRVASIFSGGFKFKNGFLRLNGLDAPVENLEGNVAARNERFRFESLTGQLGGGSLQLLGDVDVYLDKAPKFNLDFFLANNRLKFFPVNFAEFSEARLSITGARPPYLFSGLAKVKRVMVRNNFDAMSTQKGSQNARYLPEKLGGAKSLYEIKIKAVADNGIFVQNDLLDAEFRGEVTLLNNFEFPQLIAKAELVRGKLLFRSTAFNLDHAYIRAPSPEYFNPQFSVGGVATVEDYRINIFASGTIDKPKISLSSSPALAQEDIISLLAFGYKGDDTSRSNPNDSSAVTYSEVGSILLEQLRISQNLQSKGVRVTVGSSNTNNEANIIRPNSNTSTVSPKIYVQTQIMKNLDATFGSTVGSTQNQEVDANLEYRISKKASLNAIYEQTPNVFDPSEKRNSIGADIKFRWGFK